MTRMGTMSDRETQGFSSEATHAKAVELAKHVLTMTTASGSGHPSTGVALSHIVVELMYRQMRYDPGDPWNPNNDRLVLSIGHGVPIVYAAYADLGGAVGTDKNNARTLTVDDLATLREQDSVLDGHPNPAEGFPFFDAATGSLGQGLSVGAGLAAAAVADGSDKRIYVIVGDGEAREGQVWEAADFIVDHKLTNLCAIFSFNGQGQACPVSLQQSAEAVGATATWAAAARMVRSAPIQCVCRGPNNLARRRPGWPVRSTEPKGTTRGRSHRHHPHQMTSGNILKT